MAYNQDPKYKHFIEEKRGRNIPDKNTNAGEASPPAAPIDWKEMKGLQKPWEAEYQADPHDEDGDMDTEGENDDEGE